MPAPTKATIASHDSNHVPTLLGVSSTTTGEFIAGQTPVTIYADPITHRLLVDEVGIGDEIWQENAGVITPVIPSDVDLGTHDYITNSAFRSTDGVTAFDGGPGSNATFRSGGGGYGEGDTVTTDGVGGNAGNLAVYAGNGGSGTNPDLGNGNSMGGNGGDAYLGAGDGGLGIQSNGNGGSVVIHIGGQGDPSGYPSPASFGDFIVQNAAGLGANGGAFGLVQIGGFFSTDINGNLTIVPPNGAGTAQFSAIVVDQSAFTINLTGYDLTTTGKATLGSINTTALPTGTLLSPPTGLLIGDYWADTTTSTDHPIIRMSTINT